MTFSYFFNLNETIKKNNYATNVKTLLRLTKIITPKNY